VTGGPPIFEAERWEKVGATRSNEVRLFRSARREGPPLESLTGEIAKKRTILPTLAPGDYGEGQDARKGGLFRRVNLGNLLRTSKENRPQRS